MVITAISIKVLQVAISTYQSELESGVEPWKLADWLINYEGGLVRRGLIGEVTNQLTSTASEQIQLILGIQVFAYLTIFGSAIFLFHRSPRTWPWIALTLSPAFLLFPYVQNAATFRKEILGIAAIGLVAVGNQERRAAIFRFVGIALYLIALLASEVNYALLPVLIWLICCQRTPISTRPWAVQMQIGFISIGTFGALLLTVAFPGNIYTATQICTSIVDRGFSIANCTGAISTLASSLRAEVTAVAQQFPGYAGYLVLLLMALFPLVMTGFIREHWRLSLVSFVTVLPLFIAALDYGRWIMLMIVGLSYAALSVSRELKVPAIRLPWFLYALFLVSWSPTFYGPPWRQESVIGRLLDIFQ